MDQNFNRTGLVNWLALIIAALGAEALSRIAVSTMGEILGTRSAEVLA